MLAFKNPPKPQAKLKIGAPNDRFEQPADSVADSVMAMPEQTLQMQPLEEDEELQMQPLEEEELQMKCEKCEEDELQMKPALQLKSDQGVEASSVFSGKIKSTKGSGSTLPLDIQQNMSSKIGANFSGVTIHTDTHAIQMNQELGARAFTHGNDIYFNSGEYNTFSTEGKHLLAHELTHVLQQRQGHMKPSMQTKGELINDDTRLDREANVKEGEALQLRSEAVQTKSLKTSLVQRQAAGQDVGNNEMPEESVEHPLWYEVTGKFQNFFGEMAIVNSQFPTVTRQNWGEKWLELWSWLGGPGERADEELRALRDTFEQMKILFDEVNTEAYELWADLINEIRAELLALAGSNFPEDVAAREVLKKQFNKTNLRVELAGAYLVPEDLLKLNFMLANGSHMAEGERVAIKEMKKQQKLDKMFREEEGVDSPSAARLAWQVVGWESPGDFAADMALTAVTFGAGKFIKWIVKGRRAKKQLQRARKLRQALKVRKAKRLKRLADGLKKLARNVKWVMENFEFVDNMEWVKKNWKKVVQSYITDELGEQLGGGDATRKKNILERASKEIIAHYIATTTGATSDLEKALFKNALFGFAAGDSKWGRHKLAQYFRTNLKRRLLTNFVFAGVRVVVLETELTAATVSGVATSTAGEMADDFADRVSGFGSVGQAIIETARKALMTRVNEWIKSAFK